MSNWIDAKKEKPEAGKMVWVACPNVVMCTHQTFLASIDDEDVWCDDAGFVFRRRVNYWQYADVPACEVVC